MNIDQCAPLSFLFKPIRIQFIFCGVIKESQTQWAFYSLFIVFTMTWSHCGQLSANRATVVQFATTSSRLHIAGVFLDKIF